MDPKSAKNEDFEVDLESGLVVLVTKDDSHKNARCNESKLSGVSVDVANVTTNKVLVGRHSLDCVGRTTPLKEKRKKSNSNKKAPKPPKAPRAPSLDAADLQLIREISELALLKRARIERMKALKKMKSAKTSSSSSSSIFALIFTVVFCIVVLLQGTPSGKSSVTSFPGSPVPARKQESGDPIIVQQYQHLNPSSSDPNSPGLDSHNFVQKITGSDLTVKPRRGGR